MPERSSTPRWILGTPLPLPLLTLTALTALTTTSCGGESRSVPARIERIEHLTRQGDFRTAAERSVDLLDEVGSGSEYYDEVQNLQREISIASALDRVRALSLLDRDHEAYDLVLELDVAFPGISAIEGWREQLELKIADYWFVRGREAKAREDFDEARAAYRTSLAYNPDRRIARQLLAELDRVEDYRAEVAEDYYFGGVSKLSDGKLPEAKGSFAKVEKYDRGNERAHRRVEQVDRALAASRVAHADALAIDDHWAAAARAYRQAAELDPESESIKRNLDAMEKEAKARAILREARGVVRRGEIDEAEALLKEALSLTALQTETIEKEIASLADRRTDLAYQKAVGLERDFQYQAAIGAYEKILEERDFYKDTRARLDVLNQYVKDAERLYAEYEAALTDAKRLELLRQIEVFWPEYRDIAVRIDELSR